MTDQPQMPAPDDDRPAAARVDTPAQDRSPGARAQQRADQTAALTAALLEIERFVAQSGWDQPARLFALVETDALIAAEPALAAQLQLRGSADGAPPGALTSIEQEDFVAGDDLGATLAGIGWPPRVHGCALVLERTVLPSSVQLDLPDDPEAAAAVVAADERHDEMRIVAGAVRTAAAPGQAAVIRLRKADELLSGPGLVPHLSHALAETLLPGQA